MSRQLRLVIPDLSVCPVVTVPEGFHMRGFEPQDADQLYALVDDVFTLPEPLKPIARRQVAEVIERAAVKPKSLSVAARGSEVAGIGFAYELAPDNRDAGYVHLFAVKECYKNSKIGRSLLTSVIKYFHDEGFACAFADTDDDRLGSIYGMLTSGFFPLYVAPDHAARWQRLGTRLALPTPCEPPEPVKARISPRAWDVMRFT